MSRMIALSPRIVVPWIFAVRGAARESGGRHAHRAARRHRLRGLEFVLVRSGRFQLVRPGCFRP